MEYTDTRPEVVIKKLDLAWDITKGQRLNNEEDDTLLARFRKVYHHISETLQGKKDD